jgi:Tol biopolymer transport system component
MLKQHSHQRDKMPIVGLLLLLILMWICGENYSAHVLANPQNFIASEPDKLAYTFVDGQAKHNLMLYDPASRINTTLLRDIDYYHFYRFNLSVDGYLAFAVMHEAKSKLYLLDTNKPDSVATYIAQGYLLGWSKDGHYLAFAGYEGEDEQIYLWNGSGIINITPEDLGENAKFTSYDPAWSFDGRLAFTVSYGLTSEDEPSELYLWDGHTTINLSQNPRGNDENPAWSADGRLAFLSSREMGYDIFIWDGVSFDNRLPDVTTFTNAAPELTHYMSYPTWTHDGYVAFGAFGAFDIEKFQIYVWDGQTATNVSRIPTLHSGSPTWSLDGRLAFTTFFSEEQLLYVRDGDGRTLLATHGQYSPAWSPNGYLLFCKPNWTLSVWDGQEISAVAHGGEIQAQWQNGEGVFCSNG